MKVSSSELPPRQVALDIEVEQERVDRAMEEAFRRLAPRVNVPGFRRGKAPRPLVERVIGRERVLEEALEHLVPQVLSDAIKQEQVEAYDRPRIESIELEPLRVKARVPLAPRVELGDYRAQLRVTPEPVEVDAEQVDGVIQRLREAHAQWVPVERPAQRGDRVGLDVRAEVGDRVLFDSKDAEYVVDPQGPQPADGFAEAIEGLAAGGEKTFTLALPDDYRDRAVAGQPAVFSVRVHWVKAKELPEVDDAFAQQVGEYADEAALRSAIAAQLREQLEKRSRAGAEESALAQLTEISTIEVAPQVVEHQAEHLVESLTRRLEQQGLQLEQFLRLSGKSMEAFREELRDEAAQQVRRSLALEAFAEAEQVAVDRAEVEEEVRKAAAASGEEEATRTLALNSAATLARVENVLRDRKAVARLVELATRDAQPGAPAERSQESPAPERAASDTQQESDRPAATIAGGETQEHP